MIKKKKRLVSSLCKELLQINKKKTKQAYSIIGRRHKQKFRRGRNLDSQEAYELMLSLTIFRELK